VEVAVDLTISGGAQILSVGKRKRQENRRFGRLFLTGLQRYCSLSDQKMEGVKNPHRPREDPDPVIGSVR
ncbi:MAG: hypothetical protein VCE43_01645, partial [Myxococcota bacterium]